MRWRSWSLVGTLCLGAAACGSSGDADTSSGTTGSGTNDTTSVSVTLTMGSSISESASASATDTETSMTAGSSGTTATSMTNGTSSTTETGTTDDSGSTSGTGGGTDGTSGTGGMTELGPGSLAFIGVNSDLPEGFALVALENIPSGTELRFTERAWNENTMAFEVSEGTATLVLDTALSAGTVFEVGVQGQTTLDVTPDIGTITSDGTGNWGIAGNGDNLFVYLGADDDPTFIAGVAFSSPSVWTTDGGSLDGQSSMIPGTLSEMAGTITTHSDDNVRYNGARTGQGSIGAYLALIADEANNYETGNMAYSPLAGADFAP